MYYKKTKWAEKSVFGATVRNNIPYRNRAPYGWWIASYIQRVAWDDDPNPNPNKRCLAWENTIILQASDREAAFDKAMQLVSQDKSEFEDHDGNRKGHWVFEGLTSLLAIHDKLEDGAEVLWVEHKSRTIGRIRSWVKKKHELEVFDDTPGIGDKKS